MRFVLFHCHTALCALSNCVVLEFIRVASFYNKDHELSLVRKSCAKHKDSVRRENALWRPFKPKRLWGGILETGFDK